MSNSGTTETTEQATLGGGCFWCMEAVFKALRGVVHVQSGYAGGHVPNPTYEQVCTGTTNHAEVVQITFDPKVISYRELLEVFFDVHDPTTLNRQGNDIGTQYRSVIFTHNEAQAAVAWETISELEQQHTWSQPVVTRIEPFTAFYPAEEYHHNYFSQNPQQPYCQLVVAPKVAKFRKHFAEKIKQA